MSSDERIAVLEQRVKELEIYEKLCGLQPLDRYRIAAVQGMTAAGIYKTEDIARHAMYIARECLAIIEAEDAAK